MGTWRASTASCRMSSWPGGCSTRCWKPRCSSSDGGRHTTRSAPTALCGTGPRLRSRIAPVRSLRLRLNKRTGAIPWQGYPGDRDWFHSWGQVTPQTLFVSPAIALLLIGRLPPTEFRLITAPGNRGPPHTSGPRRCYQPSHATGPSLTVYIRSHLAALSVDHRQ